MSRTIVATLIVCVALGTVTLAAGCGDDGRSARARIPASRLEPKRTLEDMTPEERAEVEAHRAELLTSLLIWPEGKGEPRDLQADRAACRQAMESNPNISTANPLIQMTWSTRCMAEKGWVLNPEAAIPNR